MEQIEKTTSQALEKVGIGETKIEISYPTNSDFGDYTTNVALQIAKKLHRNPFELAQEIASHIPTDATIQKVQVVQPGFINFWLQDAVYQTELHKILEKKDTYGHSNAGNGKKWLIEHTSPNPNKAMHLGHLRNNVTGMAIANIWDAVGIEVIRDCIDNNRGIAIAKLMWGYLKFAKKEPQLPTTLEYWYGHQSQWNTPTEANTSPDKFVDQLYVKASEDFKDKDVEAAVRQMVIQWENGDEKNRALWKKVLDFSHHGQAQTYARLGNHFDKVWHEDEHYQLGKDIVHEGLQKRVFKKLEDGAVLSQLEAYNLPDTIIIKSDGTSLYITQDIALTKLKKDTFNPDKLHWVVGPEQTLALKQLFAICEQLGIAKREDLIHIPFGWMSLKGKGKMSSRTGNVVYIEDLLDDAKTELLQLNFTAQDKERVAEILAVGAVKYSILKVGRTTDTAFDFQTSLSLEGDSGPYLQYTYARCQSILSQSNHSLSVTMAATTTNEELAIMRHLIKFASVIENSAYQYAPNLLCSYLFELAQKFNFFYQKSPVLKAEEQTRLFRLQLTAAVAQVLKNGLSLLGIETAEKI